MNRRRRPVAEAYRASTWFRKTVGATHIGACPVCGGEGQETDRFRVRHRDETTGGRTFQKDSFVCRQCRPGGEAVLRALGLWEEGRPRSRRNRRHSAPAGSEHPWHRQRQAERKRQAEEDHARRERLAESIADAQRRIAQQRADDEATLAHTHASPVISTETGQIREEGAPDASTPAETPPVENKPLSGQTIEAPPIHIRLDGRPEWLPGGGTWRQAYEGGVLWHGGRTEEWSYGSCPACWRPPLRSKRLFNRITGDWRINSGGTTLARQCLCSQHLPDQGTIMQNIQRAYDIAQIWKTPARNRAGANRRNNHKPPIKQREVVPHD